MKRCLSSISLVLGLPAMLHAQAIRISDFGFGGGVAARPDARPAAQMSGNLRMATPLFPLELTVASASLGDRFVEATALSSLAGRFALGAGIGMHSDGGAALNGLAALRISLAARNAAVLELSARAALMRSARQGGLALSVHLSPRRGLQLGEPVKPAETVAQATGSWQAIIDEIMLQQETMPQGADVIATGSILIVKLPDAPNAEASVARIARVLNGATDGVDLAISAPDPVKFAAAATSAGFPAERITTSHTDRGVTLQATRRLALTAIRSAQWSHPQ